VVELMNRSRPSSDASYDAGMRGKLAWADFRTLKCRYSEGPTDDIVKGEVEYYPQYEADSEKLGVGAIKDEWTRQNAFLARLVTTPGASDYKVHYAKRALIAMEAALEEDTKTAEEISVNIPAAAVWIFYAGEHIYESRDEWPERWTPSEGGPLRTGRKGSCPGRWALWKERFQWVARHDAMTDEANDFAERAVEETDRVGKLVSDI